VLEGCAPIYWTCKYVDGSPNNTMTFTAYLKARKPTAPKDDGWLLLAMDAYAFFVKDVLLFREQVSPMPDVFFRDTDPLLRDFLTGTPAAGRPGWSNDWDGQYKRDKGDIKAVTSVANINVAAFNKAYRDGSRVPAKDLGCSAFGTPVSTVSKIFVDDDDLVFKVLGLKWWPWRRRYYTRYLTTTTAPRRKPTSKLGQRIVSAVDHAKNPRRIIVLGKPGQGPGYTGYMRQIRAEHPDIPVHFRKWGSSASQFLREEPLRKRNLVITTNPTRAFDLEWERSALRGRSIGSSVRSIGRRHRRKEYFDGDLDTDYTDFPAATTLGVSLGASVDGPPPPAVSEKFGDYYY
jgi:hypothetical protein